jgi:tRNA(fMet)-specific endonuclease VapC
MLDTNICIYVIKRRPVEVLRRLREVPVSEVGVSSITVSELAYGVARSTRPAQNRAALSQFLAPLETVAYGDGAAAAYGGIRATLERQGTPIGPLDLLIAAHALALGSTLVTNNEREFARVPGLSVENWASS